MRRNFYVWFCSRDGIKKWLLIIILKELDFVNNIEEEWREYFVGVIVFVLVDMFFRYLNLFGL